MSHFPHLCWAVGFRLELDSEARCQDAELASDLDQIGKLKPSLETMVIHGA